MKPLSEIANALPLLNSSEGTEKERASALLNTREIEQAARIRMMRGQLTGNFTPYDETEGHALFERMFRVYGSKWVSTYGRSIYNAAGELSEDARGWLLTIRKMTAAQGHKALQEAQKRFADALKAGGESPWPPSPLEFYAWGTIEPATQAAYKQWTGYADKSAGTMATEQKALTHNKSKRSTEAARQGIEAMKAALKSGGNND